MTTDKIKLAAVECVVETVVLDLIRTDKNGSVNSAHNLIEAAIANIIREEQLERHLAKQP